MQNGRNVRKETRTIENINRPSATHSSLLCWSNLQAAAKKQSTVKKKHHFARQALFCLSSLVCLQKKKTLISCDDLDAEACQVPCSGCWRSGSCPWRAAPGSPPSSCVGWRGGGVLGRETSAQVTQGLPCSRGFPTPRVTHTTPPANHARASKDKKTPKEMFYFWSNCWHFTSTPDFATRTGMLCRCTGGCGNISSKCT